ncbi:cytochrome b/b6 domain-containing protein [Novosphingobium sp.]|uniref:cytochrome b/b6 domain-containing protein n=1 Tax=Novosphingobium sp. TaxID=1874826 RepID=UPI003BAB9614
MRRAGELGDIQRIGGHSRWVRLTHWTIALAVFVLIFSGLAILMVHPRFYWGQAGNDLMRPLFEVPLGPNFHTQQFSAQTPFFAGSGGAATADRLAEPWNQNGWARSLHFLAAWVFLAGLAAYLTLCALTGHARRRLLPGRGELTGGALGQDLRAHLTLPMPSPPPGAPYGLLQKLTYAFIAFLALPLMVLTGVTMSPAIAANFPILLDLLGGTQSARTLHFFAFSCIALFLLVHLAMIALTGPVRHLRAIILGA